MNRNHLRVCWLVLLLGALITACAWPESPGAMTSEPEPRPTDPPGALTSPPESATEDIPAGVPTDSNEPPTEIPEMMPSPTNTIWIGPMIVDFSADRYDADPGDSLSLTWHVVPATAEVTLCRMMPTGQYGSCDEVDPEGETVVEIPLEWRNHIIYTLNTSFSGVTEIADLTVYLTCPAEWFMDSPPDACAIDPAEHTSAMAQVFEHGMMIWRADNGQILILYEDGGSPAYQIAIDSWAEGMLESDPALMPPEGLFQPVRGFGYLWRGEFGYSGIRERLGWALAPEFTFRATYQCDSAPRYNNCYLLGPDGVILLEPNHSAWSLFSP